jgi:hypothetical protein
MKIDIVLRGLHRSENVLAQDLLRVSERHRVDHEVYHVARDLAVWSRAHVREIAEVAPRYGVEVDAEPAGELGLGRAVREKAAELVGRDRTPGIVLLRDLRGIYLDAAGISTDWELLAQAAQGIRDDELLGLAARCHPETLRQMRWANAKLKESSTQVLIS